MTVTVTVENRGTAPAANVTVDGDVYPAGPVANPPVGLPGAPPTSTALAQQAIASLAVGERAQVQLTWTIPTPAPTAIQRIRVQAAPWPARPA